MHFVLDPISISDSTGEASFAAKFGCLILIENVSFRIFQDFHSIKILGYDPIKTQLSVG